IDWGLRQIKMCELEVIKTKMIQSMITSKRIATAHGYYLVAFDATGVTSYDEDPQGVLLTRKSSSGKTAYLNYILEAKIVTPDGLALSIGSEPLSNAEYSQYRKQDCELSAFKRLAAKVKRNFPRLPICVLADGLYANKPVFNICETNGWKYIVTLKDGCLSLLQEAIKDTEETKRHRFDKRVLLNQGQKNKQYGSAHYQWIPSLSYKGLELNWLECLWPQPAKDLPERSPLRFTYLTNLAPDHSHPLLNSTLAKVAEYGRMRWKIENEGFNTQKNQGFHLHHKFSRRSVSTLHVYYMLLQMAHIITQIAVHSREIILLMNKYPKLTLKYLWERLRAILEMRLLSLERLEENKRRCQIRLE
ncbi:MAG: transposase, partial [Sphingobacterium sp.]